MTKKQLQTKAEKAMEYLESVSRSYDYRNVYCVNVKRYGDYIEITDIASKYPKKVKEAIMAEFDDERVNDVYQSWLEYEGRYFCEDFLAGCTINSSEHYQELKDLVNAGKPTCYPYIERAKTVKAKLAMIEQWDKNDKKIRHYLSLIDLKSAGLYGRMGGWFGVRSDVSDAIDGLLYDIANGYTMSDIYATHDIDGIFEEVKAIEWVLNEADKFNKGLNFEEELKFRVEEFVEEVEAELKSEKEIKTAKTLAQKHGYILATAV